MENIQDARVGDGDKGTAVIRNEEFGSVTSSRLEFDRLDQAEGLRGVCETRR